MLDNLELPLTDTHLVLQKWHSGVVTPFKLSSVKDKVIYKLMRSASKMYVSLVVITFSEKVIVIVF